MFLLLFTSIGLFAQVEKGKFYLAGYSNLGLNLGKSNTTSTSVGGLTYESKNSVFNITPEVGYIVIKKLVTGLFVDYNYSSINYYSSNSTFNDQAQTDSKIIFGPFVRYYINGYKGLWPYTEGHIGFGSGKSTMEFSSDATIYHSTVFDIKLGAGATYFIMDYIGIDLILGYIHESTKMETDFSDIESDSNSFDAKIGIVLLLGKK
jgi:hypothetical protein